MIHVSRYHFEETISPESYCLGNFSVKIFLESKICKWVKNEKKLKNDVLEIALDQ